MNHFLSSKSEQHPSMNNTGMRQLETTSAHQEVLSILVYLTFGQIVLLSIGKHELEILFDGFQCRICSIIEFFLDIIEGYRLLDYSVVVRILSPRNLAQKDDSERSATVGVPRRVSGRKSMGREQNE